MKSLKKLITLFLLVSILLSFAGCGNLFSRDGLSWDGSYYQLTDKHGVVVRIPLGVSLSELAKQKGNAGGKSFWESILGLKLQAPAAMAPMSAPLGLSKGGAVASGSAVSKSSAMTRVDTEGDAAYGNGLNVMTAKAKFGFGSGEVKHPVTGEVLCDPMGNPFTAREDQVLVLQLTDRDYRVVDLDSPDAYYLVMFIIDYMGNPGAPDDTGIDIFARGSFLLKNIPSKALIDQKLTYLNSSALLVDYLEWPLREFSENCIKENTKSITSSVDEFDVIRYSFSIVESVVYDGLDESGVGVMTAMSLGCVCDSNWNVLSETKTRTIDKYWSLGMLESSTVISDEGKKINYYDENFQLYKEELYYPNEQLKSSIEYLNESTKYTFYYENGQPQRKVESFVDKETGETYYENGQLEMRWEYIYTQDGPNSWVESSRIITTYDRNGNVIAYEKYGIDDNGFYGIIESYFAESVA